jgi:hypothetical protein
MPERISKILAESAEIATAVNAQLTLPRIKMDAAVATTERVIAEAREFLDRVSGRSAQRLHGIHKIAAKASVGVGVAQRIKAAL